MKRFLIVLGTLAALSGAGAAASFGMGWVEFRSSTLTSNPCRAGKACIYPSSTDGKIHVVDTSGNDIAPGAGGGGSSDGGTTLPDQTGNGGKVLGTDGTSVSWTPPAVPTFLTFSPADYGKRHNASGQSGTGSQYETGCVFRWPVNATLTGFRWWAPTGSGGSQVLDIYNYDTGGSALGTATKTASGGAVNTISLGAPVSLTAGTGYVLSVYSALFSQILYNYGTSTNRASIAIGPSVYLELCGYHNTANSQGVLDTPDLTGTYFGIEPIYTVP